MSTLNDFLSQKRQALQTRRAKFQTTPPEPKMVKVHVNVEGGSGIRRIRIHDHQVLIDSPYDFAGYDLGPNSVELQLGVLGSCLTGIFLIQAADKGVPLDEVSIEVTGQMDMRAGKPGYEHIPVYPHNIEYTVHIKSSASPETLADLHQTVERVCPIFNLLANPQIIKGTLVQTGTLTETKAAVKKATPDFYYHERLHFGSMVSPLSYRDPVFLARQAMSIDDLSNGRMILGVGTGWSEREHTMFGYDLLGFSAGARLTMGVVMNCDPDSRPDSAAPIYGGGTNDKPVSAAAPPLFILGAADAPIVARGPQLYSAWREAGHSAELHPLLRPRLARLLSAPAGYLLPRGKCAIHRACAGTL